MFLNNTVMNVWLGLRRKTTTTTFWPKTSAFGGKKRRNKRRRGMPSKNSDHPTVTAKLD